MIRPARRSATYQDVLDAPEHMVAELIEGELYLQPRPAQPHAEAASVLAMLLGPPFRLGRGGPGGWRIQYEPELHLGAHVLVPDLAGWQVEAVPAPPPPAFEATPGRWVVPVDPQAVAGTAVVALPKPKRWTVPEGAACALRREGRTAVVTLTDGAPDAWTPCVEAKGGEAVAVRAVPFVPRWDQSASEE